MDGLTKKERKEKRNRKYFTAAKKLAELTQKAIDKGKPCNIMVWSDGETANGEFCRFGRRYDIGIIEKRTGEKWLDWGENPNYPITIFAHFNIIPGSEYSLGKEYIRYVVSPSVITWQGKVINNALKNIKVPDNAIFRSSYMDCKRVNPTYKRGKYVTGV